MRSLALIACLLGIGCGGDSPSILSPSPVVPVQPPKPVTVCHEEFHPMDVIVVGVGQVQIIPAWTEIVCVTQAVTVP